jgi:hypothetical protein
MRNLETHHNHTVEVNLIGVLEWRCCRVVDLGFSWISEGSCNSNESLQLNSRMLFPAHDTLKCCGDVELWR